MIVKDLINNCPIKKISSIMLGIVQVKDTDKLNKEKIRSFSETLEEVVEKFKKIDPVDTGHIVFAMKYMDEFSEDNFEYDTTLLYKKADIVNEFTPRSPLSSITDVFSLSNMEVKDLLNGTKLPQSYAFEFSPWKEILGYEIFIPNVKEFGLSHFLAAVFYEMTFFGFNESDMKAEREKLDESTAEIQEIKKLPEEEQKKHFKPLDEVFAEFGYVDDRTEKEKAEEEEKMFRICLENRKRENEILEKYYNEKNL